MEKLLDLPRFVNLFIVIERDLEINSRHVYNRHLNRHFYVARYNRDVGAGVTRKFTYVYHLLEFKHATYPFILAITITAGFN